MKRLGGSLDRAPWESALSKVCMPHWKLGVMFVVIKGQENRGRLGCYTVSTDMYLTVLANDHSVFILRVKQSWVHSKRRLAVYQATRRESREGLNL
jgi:hypothetical protein